MRRALLSRDRGFLMVVLVLFAGCSILAPRPDPSRFFVLEAIPPAGVLPVRSAGNPFIGLGPIRLPDYLVDRREMITRRSATEVAPSEIDRWAESLDVAIPRVLGLDLSSELGQQRVVLYPWYETQGPDFQVAVNFERFEVDADGNAALVARFEARGLRGPERRLYRETRASRTPATGDGAARAAALSQVLAELGRDIAAAIQELEAS